MRNSLCERTCVSVRGLIWCVRYVMVSVCGEQRAGREMHHTNTSCSSQGL